MDEVWQHTFRAGKVLVLEECPRRGRRVYARWWAHRSGRRRGLWRKRSLGFGLRDPDTEVVDPQLERRALRLGTLLHGALRDGRNPAEVPLGEDGPLRIRDGLRRYLDVGTGAFAAETRHRRAMVRAAQQLVDILGDVPWVALGPEASTHVWRALARRYRDGRGWRIAEQTLGLLLSACDWLRLQGLIPSDAGPTRVRQWRRRMALEWTQLTGCGPRVPHRPRYDMAEIGRLLRAAEDPRVDARVRLLLLLAGPESRLAAVASRARRSHLDLAASGAGEYGSLDVPGAGSKRGVRIVIERGERAALDRALGQGHLADLEDAYQRDGLDYFLCPGGRARAGRYASSREPRPLSPATLRRQFARLEDLAGVPHRAGRALHGLRRTAAEVASTALSSDSRALDYLGSWAGGTVRERIYVDRESEAVALRGEALRARLRRLLRERATPTPGTPGHASPRTASHTAWRARREAGTAAGGGEALRDGVSVGAAVAQS